MHNRVGFSISVEHITLLRIMRNFIHAAESFDQMTMCYGYYQTNCLIIQKSHDIFIDIQYELLKCDNIMQNPLFINSIQKAISVLEAVAHERQGLSLTEISRVSGMTMGSVQRLTYTLTKVGYITKDSITKKFTLTPKSLTLAYHYLNHAEVRDIAYQYLRELNEITQETVNLAVMGDGIEIVYIDRVETSHMITTNIRPGRTRPVYSTSIGKVILAFMDDKKRGGILKDIEDEEEFRKSGITMEKFLVELQTVKMQGYATNLSELDRDLLAVAAPIRNHMGITEAGINIVVPQSRASLETLEKDYIPLLIEKSTLISNQLGFIEDAEGRNNE